MSLNFSFKTQSKIIPTDVLFDFVTLGGGPASLNAALYAKRKGLKTLLIAKKMGGNLLNTDSVENYLGLDFMTGEGMAEKFEAHLKSLDVEILSDTLVTRIQKVGDIFELTLESGEIIRSKTVNLSMGSTPRELNVTGENHFKNSGVAYCAICDAPLFKGKKVIIAGGGNSAVEAAIDVAKYASKVIVVHRSEFRADAILVERMKAIEGIEIYTQTQILEMIGDVKLRSVKVLDKKTGIERLIDTDGIFIEIGHLPHSSLVKDFVELNEKDEIIIDAFQRTNIPGLFASGDVTNVPYKQIILSVADGAKAALSASEYINNHF